MMAFASGFMVGVAAMLLADHPIKGAIAGILLNLAMFVSATSH